MLLSVQLRIAYGCCHRDHAPRTFELLDRRLGSISQDGFVLEDHASGPKFLLQVDSTPPATALTDKLLALVTTVMDARNDGIQNGDTPCGPVDIVLGRAPRSGEYREKIFATVETGSKIESNEVRKDLEAFVGRWISEPCAIGR